MLELYEIDLKLKLPKFHTGPEVIKAVTHEEVSFAALEGTTFPSQESGVCDLVATEEIRGPFD